MRSTASDGPLTLFLKSAGALEVAGDAVQRVGHGVAQIGGAIWNGAGHVAPDPLARAALLGAMGVGAATQGPELAGRWSQGAKYVRGETPTLARGF